MANVQLTVLYVALWAFLPCRARFCLSRCCNMAEIEEAGSHLTSRLRNVMHMPSHLECQASGSGSVGQMSISPWSYVKDENSTRIPFRLWQARCNCRRCIALNTSLALNDHRRDTNHFGTSKTVTYDTTVFYRTPCEADPNRFRLVPDLYTVSVGCTCVVTVKKAT